MTYRGVCFLSILTAFTLHCATSNVATDAVDQNQGIVANSYGNLPLSFEANLGQSSPRVKFLSRNSGYSLYLTGTEAVLVLSQPESPEKPDIASRTKPADKGPVESAVLRLKLVDSNQAAEVVGEEKLPGKSNYLTGDDPSKWHTDISHYSKVRYRDVYPGVDLVYYGTNQRQLEYDFVVAPGADPAKIKMAFEGAEELTLDDQGNVVVGIPSGEVLLNAPVMYQETNGGRQQVSGHFVLNGDQIHFEVGTYVLTEL